MIKKCNDLVKLLLGIFYGIDLPTKRACPVMLLAIPADVLAGDAHTHVFPVKIVQILQMPLQQAAYFSTGDSGKCIPRLQEMINLAENPRAPLGGATQHHRIGTG